MQTLTRIQDWIFGKKEPVFYRLSHVFNFRRPFPLMKLLHFYSKTDYDVYVPRFSKPFYEWRNEVQHQLQRQIQALAHLQSCIEYNMKPPARLWDWDTPFPNFKLEVKRSQIKEAGQGLYLGEGTVSRGQVIAFQPGLSYFKVPQGYIDQYGLNLRWSRGARDYLVTMEREIWVDGNPRSQVVLNALKNNIFALGHFINHPTISLSPNVIPVFFDWGPELVSNVDDQHMKPYIHGLQTSRINLDQFVCNEFGWEFIKAESEWIPGCAYVALRDIQPGEEIFADYEWEYNIDSIMYSKPSDITLDWPWYTVVDQAKIDALIEPFLSKENFDKLCASSMLIDQEKVPRELPKPTDTQNAKTPTLTKTPALSKTVVS
ncbi:hypothetical protein RFI_01621 [Reticulomyxa filosa]|uniref:SET domain-containing protein n=1 Tax=Reticulomyxa filosa TaxID=46433 RepID=X6PCQ8_RETFI|nr:hypothetical protein RFI_01621 [Reticulomyxa filosa]|eukprot:ETO35442.1 hypothetical protein RFI_01621 [Reticulomyxa filosa]